MEELAQMASMPVAVAHSLVTGEVLAALVAREYGLVAKGTARLLQSGLNDHYLLSTHDGDVVVRVYRRGWRSPQDVAWELALVEHLACARAPVAGCHQTSDGRLFTSLHAPEGERQVAVFALAAGPYTHFGTTGRSRISPAHCAEPFGRSLAAIHAAADWFVAPAERFALDLDHLLNQPLTAIAAVYPHRVAEVAALRQVAAELAHLLSTIGLEQLDWGPCHGDTSGGNSTYWGGQVIHFDFDCGGPGWRAYDLGVFLWSLTINGHSDDVWQPFLSGYLTTRPLSDHDLAAVPVFAAIRVVWLLGLWCANAHVVGYARLHDDYLDRELAAPIPFSLQPVDRRTSLKSDDPAAGTGIRLTYCYTGQWSLESLTDTRRWAGEPQHT